MTPTRKLTPAELAEAMAVYRIDLRMATAREMPIHNRTDWRRLAGYALIGAALGVAVVLAMHFAAKARVNGEIAAELMGEMK